jgi:hypothetical protein
MDHLTPIPAMTRSRIQRVLLRAVTWAFPALMIWTTLLDRPLLPAFLSPTAERTLYFKLPIAGARFHWEFLDPDAFLAGELTLRIINDDRDETLVVFREGQIQEGWEMIGTAGPDRGFYFGFSTDRRFRTARDDSLVITLTAPRDLRGRGPDSEGTLPAGTWQMTGTYSGLYGRGWNLIGYMSGGDGAPVAFMECWDSVWPITITKSTGWMGLKPADEDESGWFQKFRPERGVDGRRCGSHI